MIYIKTYGRTTIYANYTEKQHLSGSQKEIENKVIDIMESAIPIHEKNKEETKYLWDYYSGIQDIYTEKQKLTRTDIDNRTVENWAYAIVDFKKAYYENINTLCVGSSYAQFGIETKLYSYLSNCSLGSQDMYYSYKIIREVCDKNDNIENIVLVTAYYYFYSDLSLTKDLGELSRVSRVYYPLFNDLHNAILVPPCSSFFPISNILDIEKLIDKNSKASGFL